MIADPKSDALIENFAGQWLQIRNLNGVTPDPTNFHIRRLTSPGDEAGDGNVFGALMREDRSVLELIDSDFTYLNERLAKHYGIDDVKGTEFQRVSLAKGSGRGGILTHASILTIPPIPPAPLP